MSARLKLALIVAAEGDLTSLPPLGPACVAAALRRDLPGAETVLCRRLDELLRAAPDIAGISATTDNYALAVRWARRIRKELGIPVILGGPHISLAPWSLDTAFDAAVIGEGESTVPALLSSYLRDGGFSPEALSRIPGLAWRRGGEVRLSAPRPAAPDLASLPRPYPELAAFYGPGGARHISSARGCPFSCDFCSSSRLFPGFRALPAAGLAADIEDLAARGGAERLVFYDDLFIADKRRLRALAAELRRRGLSGRCRLTVSARADLLDAETCGLMAEIGVDLAAMGLESFSDSTLRDLGKGGLTAAANQRALDLLAGTGIKALGLFMFGAPEETRADAEATLEAVHRNIREGKLLDAQWSLLSPYPGTPAWDRAEAAGLVSRGMDWSLFSGGRNPSLYMGGKLPLPELESLLAACRDSLRAARPGYRSPSLTSLFEFSAGA